MKLIIDIPEKEYAQLDKWSVYYFREVISKGTPLPKGHGRLIDSSALPQEDKNITVKSILKPNTIACIGAITLQEYINNLPTIIEADKGE